MNKHTTFEGAKEEEKLKMGVMIYEFHYRGVRNINFEICNGHLLKH